MKKSEFFNIGLPKWPALVVVGDRVTNDQAAEILIRTSHLSSLQGNDRDFESRLNEVLFGIYESWWKLDEIIAEREGITKYQTYEWMRKKVEIYHPLSLNYLNNHQIISSWVGGPHGWCNWQGNIFANTYNIGKWPNIEEVYNDWKIIAKEFPFLTLKSQLFDEESCEEGGKPVIQFIVKEGKVKMSLPKAVITPPVSAPFINIFSVGSERGCSIHQFKDALNLVKNKFNEEVDTRADAKLSSFSVS